MPEKDIDIGRLCESMTRSRWALRRFREERREATRQYIGRHWSEEGTVQQVPVNLISTYVRIVTRSLISKNPRVLISTFEKELKPMASAMESWSNLKIDQMDLAGTLQRNVTDALFSLGICKVALATPADAASVGWGIGAGKPYAESVDLDDFVFDVHARDFREVTYIGHRFRVPLDVVKDSKLYSKARKKLEPSSDNPYNYEGDERISMLGRTYYTNSSAEFEDHVDLWEIYLPRHRVVLTLPHEYFASTTASDLGMNYEPLREQKWIGPPWGPYSMLGYGIVPGNAMPKAPIQDLIDLHQAVNNGYRKMIRQTERQKEIVPVTQGRTDDAKRVVEANDGEVIRVDNPDNIKPVSFGGPNNSVFLISQHFKDLFSWMGGNLDVIGGLSPQSKTLGQDKMLNENATASIADMQAITVKHTQRVLRSLCWYWWHDPQQVMKTTYNLPGLPDASIVRRVQPYQRAQVPFEELDFKVDPYSMQAATPSSRAAALNQILQQLIIPMAGILQQQGVALDMNVALTKLARYMDMPDLNEILTLQEPPQDDTTSAGGGDAGAGGPAPGSTSREYVRRSIGQDTQANREGMATSKANAGWNEPVGAA